MNRSFPRLSIVIPCYGRHEMVNACIASMRCDRREEIEIVLVDDGSIPPLAGSLRVQPDVLLRQENCGRSMALRAGILAATGEYCMIMDSDDEIVDCGVARILKDLDEIDDERVIGLVYECASFESGDSIANLPIDTVATLLELRADYRVKGDLKEVVRTELVRDCLYPASSERRVPTSYIWAGVSAAGPVLVRPFAIVRHRYLPSGMSDSIDRLKRDNPAGLMATYLRIATASDEAYRSKRFRFAYSVRVWSVAGAKPTPIQQQQMRRCLGLWMHIAAKVAGMAYRLLS